MRVVISTSIDIFLCKMHTEYIMLCDTLIKRVSYIWPVLWMASVLATIDNCHTVVVFVDNIIRTGLCDRYVKTFW